MSLGNMNPQRTFVGSPRSSSDDCPIYDHRSTVPAPMRVCMRRHPQAGWHEGGFVRKSFRATTRGAQKGSDQRLIRLIHPAHLRGIALRIRQWGQRYKASKENFWAVSSEYLGRRDFAKYGAFGCARLAYG
jgi:hypothetical protein